MAKAAKYVVVEVEHFLEDAFIDPGEVHLPGVFVHAVVRNEVL